MASHAFEPHTGEVKVRLEAASFAELLVEAARALAELLGVAEDTAPTPWRLTTVTGRDRETLLVAWLDELIARTEIEYLLYRDAEIDQVTDTRVEARIRGVPLCETRTAVKAATLHGLQVETGANGVSATVVLDV